MTESASIILSREFMDSDDLADAVRSWGTELSRLDPGPFRGILTQVVGRDCLLMRTFFSKSIVQRGSTPPGMRTFGIPLSPDVEMTWRGRKTTGQDLLLFPSDGELDATSQGEFDIFPLSVRPDLLDEVCRETAGRSTADVLGHVEAFSVPEKNMKDLRRICLRQLRVAMAGRRQSSECARTILASLLFLLPGNDQDSRRAPSARRGLAVRRAEEYLREHAVDAPTVSDLSRVANVSKRTLEYAFMEWHGMSPKSYTMAMRLNGARRDLRISVQVAKVADVANRWGFWHMGQFASDYRRMFGELPSQTLRLGPRAPGAA